MKQEAYHKNQRCNQ